ncbi:hypothetical protein Tco_0643261 [Tanacetum coccineum]
MFGPGRVNPVHLMQLNAPEARDVPLLLQTWFVDEELSVDSLAKRAYENWNWVTEYDGKFLSALTFPAPPAQHDSISICKFRSKAGSHINYGSNEPFFDSSADWSDPQGHGFGDSFSEEVQNAGN